MRPILLLIAATITLICIVNDSFAQNAASYWLANGNTTGASQNPLNLGNWSSPSNVASYQLFTSDVGGGGNFELRAARWASSVAFTRGDPNGVYDLMTLFSVSGCGTSMGIYNSTNQVSVSFNGQGTSYFNGGNLLIGKTSQTNSSYLLDVNGPARANQVVVNTTGADFVFNPGYPLPPLAEVEKYIQANHHLPDIASAAQMQDQGLDLGENQTRLLQKIEELTLYVIDQNKQLEALKKENKRLEEQNGALQLLEQRIERLEQSLGR